ncbi:hypothetical protein J2W32_004486 [Variovorax boronicumulans]|uniref:Uncharacterized protein n=1 Tax=Variovorax boronicumulans TaxID=436515 RepID=A0AAW8D3R1_9BURK|nr:hypothetical protein [Variovorax boronicumulans]MDP9895388.1 hypothetical protein [Variovorax boronicumulans]MDQ0055428.1 hypothetical protein [Variovorax boronicumulans]
MSEWYEAYPEVGSTSGAAAPPASTPTTAPAAVTPLSATPSSAPAAAPAPQGNWWDQYPEVGQRMAAARPPSASAPGNEPSLMSEVGRQVGLTARAAVKGALSIPAIASDAVTGVINTGLDAARGEGNGFRFQRVGAAADNLMSGAGLPEPKDATERVVQDVASGMLGAATGAGAGQLAAQAARSAGAPVAAAVGEGLAAAPGMQIASGATGAGAAGTVREEGGGAVAQTVAGLAGALAPSAVPFAARAAVRGAIRGGEAGRAEMADRIATFEDATGTTPTLGQATGSRSIQAAETGLSNVVGGSSFMIRRGEAQAAAMQKSVQDLTDALSPNATGADAGEAIARGVNAFKDNVKTVQQRLYSDLDRYIPAATPMPVGRTQAALESLNEGIPGAPNISNFFKNARIGSIEHALREDLELARQALVPTGMTSTGVSTAAGQLPYQAVQKLRSLVGREISDNSLTSDVPRSKWRALYAALSDDLGQAAAMAGPRAEQTWARANQYTRSSIQRLEQLETVVNRDAPEKVFKAATTGLAEGGTTINRVMKSMPVENRREVAAAVLQRLGRAKPGQQNEMGDAFSSETFLTNLAAMSPAARGALFGSAGYPGLEARVRQLGAVASMRREGSKVFANPSGTARQTALIGWMGGLMTAFATGNPVAIAGAVGTPFLAAVGARALTSPTVVRDIATPARLNEAFGPVTAAAAARVPTFEERKAANKARIRAMREGKR